MGRESWAGIGVLGEGGWDSGAKRGELGVGGLERGARRGSWESLPARRGL